MQVVEAMSYIKESKNIYTDKEPKHSLAVVNKHHTKCLRGEEILEAMIDRIVPTSRSVIIKARALAIINISTHHGIISQCQHSGLDIVQTCIIENDKQYDFGLDIDDQSAIQDFQSTSPC